MQTFFGKTQISTIATRLWGSPVLTALNTLGKAECSNYCTIGGIFIKQTKCTFFCMDCYIRKNLSFSVVIRTYIYIGKV